MATGNVPKDFEMKMLIENIWSYSESESCSVQSALSLNYMSLNASVQRLDTFKKLKDFGRKIS